MILILDTDHLTAIQGGTEPAYMRLRFRLQSFSTDNVCTTIVSFEEQMRGWLSFIANHKSDQQEVFAYNRLHTLLNFFCEIKVLDYDEAAARYYSDLRRLKLRIGSMDLKIAATAMSKDALLLSSNIKDFQKVPHLRVEDWTIA
jgi:tRNA(fMet)-specific endonuclease VapC